LRTAGRVFIAGGIANERIGTAGRVEATGGVVIKRIATNGRVFDSRCVGN